MPKEMNPIISNVLTAVGTAAVMGVIAWVGGVFEAGTAAIDKEQIREVLQEELKTDAGKTYKARLSELDSEVIVLETRVGTLVNDVDDLEDTVFDLAGGNR